MSAKKLLKHWAKITDQSSLCLNNADLINKLDNIILPSDMKNWIIRKCDRDDYNDWMPYRVCNDKNRIRVYYTNTNGNSKFHKRHLVLNVDQRIIPTFTEYEGVNYIDTYLAVVENKPSANKPTDNESMDLSMYFSTFGKSYDPPTINGKPVQFK